METRFDMGVMDLYPIVANKTKIENNPFLQVKMKEKVDADRLYDAVKEALVDYPLFACTLKYNNGYYLEINKNEFELIASSEQDRPLVFGDHTKGYLWQICYDEYVISLEWCHGVSDGRGGYAFFSAILRHYFGIHIPVVPAFEPGLESFYDKEEKGIKQKKQENGFRASDVPYSKRGYRTDCHILKAPMQEVLALTKRSDASPATVLPPLFSRALRKYIRPTAKNKNVCCNVVVDCRGVMGFETMHNCIISKNITYVDKFDKMDFSLVSTLYRAILDLAVQKENIIAEATKTTDMIRPIVNIRPRFLQKTVGKIVADVLKHSDSNFTFTYLGKVNLPDEVMDGIDDFNFRSWTDFGECNIAAVDFKDVLILNICENYIDKNIVPEFVSICSEVGIHFTETETLLFEQANLRLH